MAELDPCDCPHCEAERWVVRAAADPSTPALIRVALATIALHLEEFRARQLAAALPRSRGRRLLDAVRASWVRLGERAAGAFDWIAGEPAAVIAAALWASLWFWGSLVWACVVGSWSLRGLALVAGVGWVVGNAAGLRRMRGQG